MTASDQNQFSWREAFLVYTQRPVIAMFFFGCAARLPLLLVFSTLTAWLNDYGIEKTAIGFFGWVGITYSIKVFWSPIVDQLPVPPLTRMLGQRRSWMMIGQIGIALGLLLLSLLSPQHDLLMIALCALVVAFSSSTQDIAIDAFRIESAIQEFQGAMSATYIFGYRIAMLVAGAGALYIAEFQGWSMSYRWMALLMLVGVVTTLLVKEPEKITHRNKTFAD